MNVAAVIGPRSRQTHWPILSRGFRLMFLCAGAWAALAMVLWIAMLSVGLVLPVTWSPLDWHVHELIYGYVPAVVAGFLLTAVPNWTGRLPIAGKPLLFLGALWVAGRLAVVTSDAIGAVPAALVDLAFLAVLAAVVGREIVLGRNWRNAKVLGLVILLLAGNAVFHWDAAGGSAAAGGVGARIGIAAAVALIIVIGGRIVPSFTRNWLARLNPGRLPAPYAGLDTAFIAAAAIALTAWVIAPGAPETGVLCILAGVLHVWRLVRWAGDRTLGEPLVLVLHVGYAFVPVGFLLVGAASLDFGFFTSSAALHAWTAGAIGVMTLAVMTRASLGHTGRDLHATPAIAALYAFVALAAVARIFAGFGIAPQAMVHVAAAAWAAGFAGFVVLFAPLLVRRT